MEGLCQGEGWGGGGWSWRGPAGQPHHLLNPSLSRAVTHTPTPPPPSSVPLLFPQQGLLHEEPEVLPPLLLLLASWGPGGARTGTGHHPAERQAVERKETISRTVLLSKYLLKVFCVLSPGNTAGIKTDADSSSWSTGTGEGTDQMDNHKCNIANGRKRWNSKPR